MERAPRARTENAKDVIVAEEASAEQQRRHTIQHNKRTVKLATVLQIHGGIIVKQISFRTIGNRLSVNKLLSPVSVCLNSLPTLSTITQLQ